MLQYPVCYRHDDDNDNAHGREREKRKGKTRSDPTKAKADNTPTCMREAGRDSRFVEPERGNVLLSLEAGGCGMCVDL